MESGRWVVLAGVVLALLSVVSISQADDPIGRISFGASGGFSSYALESVNSRISHDGSDFLDLKGWEPIDNFKHGWTFWTDLRIPLPLGEMTMPLPLTSYRLPVELSIAGGIGTSSGATTGPSSNELLEIEGKQSYYHARLLYTLPFRPMEDMRIFIGGGPLIISDQELVVRHTARDAAANYQRVEQVTYSGDGLGWQLGLAVEYMAHDYITLAFDFAYRWARLDYSNWSPDKSIVITDSDPISLPSEGGIETTNVERLYRDDSYILQGFLDWETVADMEESSGVHEYGPYIGMLQPLRPSNLDLDFTGVQVHLGFRFYFL